MIRLPYTGTYSLELITAQNGAQVVVCYSDKTATDYSGGTQATAITSATTTTICATPAASTIRDVDFVSVKNTYAGSHTVTVQLDVNGTNYPLFVAALLTDESLNYTHGSGWQVKDANGNTKASPLTAMTSAQLAGIITDETGSGALVFANSPTLVAPALGTPSSGVVTNLTGTANININGTVGETTPAAGNFTTLGVTGNVTLGDASADIVTVNGHMGIGGAGNAAKSLYIQNSISASNPLGVDLRGTYTATGGSLAAAFATGGGGGLVANTGGAINAYGCYLSEPNVTVISGSVTNAATVFINEGPTEGSTLNANLYTNAANGTNKWNIYASGTAPNYFAGVVNVEDGTALLPSIVNNGDPNTGIWFPAADTVAVSTAGEKRVEVAPDGDLVLSNTTGSGYRKLWFTGDGDATASSRIGAITKNYDSPYDLNIYASYGTTATPASTIFYRYNGGEYFRIASNGCTFKTQAEPATVNSSATLTAANLAAKIITSTSVSAVTATLPTGTSTEAVIGASQPVMAIDTAIEWSIINTGPNAVTVAANTDHTTVGGLVVAAGTSGRFCTRKTATNTFITYRLS